MSRTPKNLTGIVFSGITEGDVPGTWLLSYNEDGLSIAVAIFDTEELALDMAAQIDDLTKITHDWTIETVFTNPRFADELIDMLGMDPGCYGCTGCDDLDLDEEEEDDLDDTELDDEEGHDRDDGIDPTRGFPVDI
jgi:hypothetical protein